MKNIRAVLFDMDGLLVDSESLSIACAVQVAQEMGFDLEPAAVARAVCGVRREYAVQAYASVLPDHVDAASFYERKNELLRQQFRAGMLRPKKGAAELLKWLHQQGVVCVLATATQYAAAKERLEGLGLWDALPYRITGNDVSNGKPHPETYLKAAAAADAAPQECLVLEDSYNGIRAGRAAGAIVGMVPDMLPYSELCAPYCDMVFADLTEVISWLQMD